MSKENIKPLTTPNNSLNPNIYYNDSAKTHVKFDKSYLKQDKVPFTHKTLLNFYFAFKIDWCPYYDTM